MLHLRTEKEITSKWKVSADTPLVSICCITFNHQEFISKTLDGFLMQETNFPIEIIINDDCSDDLTPDILKSYENRYPNIIKVIYQETNRMSQLINPLSEYVFPNAKGQFIAICEGDDYWVMPDKLSKQVEIFNGNRKISLVHSDVGHLVSLKKDFDRICLGINKVTHRHPSFGNMSESSWFSCSVFTCSMMIKKEIITEFLNSGVVHCGMASSDRALYLFAAQRGEIGYLDEVTSVYRQNKTSLTNADKSNFVNFAIGAKNLMQFSLNFFNASNNIKHNCIEFCNKRIFKTILKFGSLSDLHRVELDQVVSSSDRVLIWVSKLMLFEKIYHLYSEIKFSLKVRLYYSQVDE